MSGPFLNVTAALVNPDLTERFTVKRRTQTVDTHGRAVIAEAVMSAVGVITMEHGNDLVRESDSQRMGRNLMVITKFRLRGPAPGYQPDLVVWEGDEFTVVAVDPYTRFGAGFVQARCSSRDIIDQAPA